MNHGIPQFDPSAKDLIKILSLFENDDHAKCDSCEEHVHIGDDFQVFEDSEQGMVVICPTCFEIDYVEDENGELFERKNLEEGKPQRAKD